MRLTRAVIGVLTQDHHFDRFKWRQLERAENLPSRRIDALAGSFLGAQEGGQPSHVR